MKRLLAFMLAGVMLLATPVMAAEAAEDGVEDVGGDVEGDDEENGEENAGSKSPSASTVKPKPKRKPKREEAEPPAPAVEASPVSAAVTQAAAAEGKTVGEYMNNMVVTVPGLDNAIPIGQGGHVIINGAPSNQVFSVLKPALVNVNSAKIFAASLGGRLLTVGRISASVNGFQTARVNFYMKGVTAGQNIKVFQTVGGQWLEVDVVEIRADHVVVDMTGLGTLAFIEVP
ncbi:MAG: hypothetical protein K2M20_06695 [Lachnospiraceae bacterium]|nr:hypothetical protein [Lachnospiraceae bacterium]